MKRCRQCGITVILDECFSELSGIYERREDRTKGRGLIILKAFTKLYAMPGMRLGYCLCGDTAMAEQIRVQLPCWNVSAAAQLAGLTALDSKKRNDFISQSVEFIRTEREFLQHGLVGLGLRVIPGQANFLCFYCGQSLYERLLPRGILIRDCSSFRGMGQGWYRAAVRTREENKRLLRELGIFIKG